MIVNNAEFIHFYKSNKLKIVIKLNLTDAFEQIVENIDDDLKIDEVDLMIVTDDEFEEKFKDVNEQCSVSYEVRKVFNIYNAFQERKKEKKKEKEKKEIYKERKDKEKRTEKQKEVPENNPQYLDISAEVYTVSKKADEVYNKNNKSNANNVEVSHWSAKQFHQHLMGKYKEAYGHNSLEFGTYGGKKYGQSAQGVIWTTIKRKLIDVFIESDLTRKNLKEYIDWVYDKKYGELKFPVTLNFLCSKSLIAEWLLIKYDEKKNGGKMKITAKIHKFNG